MKLNIDMSDLQKEKRKLYYLNRKIKITGKRSPRMAAEYMVRKARVLAGNRKGIMRKNINAFKRGKNSYEVISHRWSRANEWRGNPKNQYRFPVHLWMEGKIKGSWNRIPYAAVRNKTGTPGYFSKAEKETRKRFRQGVRKDIQRALRMKF